MTRKIRHCCRLCVLAASLVKFYILRRLKFRICVLLPQIFALIYTDLVKILSCVRVLIIYFGDRLRRARVSGIKFTEPAACTRSVQT